MNVKISQLNTPEKRSIAYIHKNFNFLTQFQLIYRPAHPSVELKFTNYSWVACDRKNFSQTILATLIIEWFRNDDTFNDNSYKHIHALKVENETMPSMNIKYDSIKIMLRKYVALLKISSIILWSYPSE